MASFRRSMSLVQRDGTVAIAQNGEESRDDSSSPKLYYNRTYLAFRRYSSLLTNSLNLVMMFDRIQAAIFCIFWRRSSRSVERSRQKGQYWKKAFSYFFICFMAGFFIGFTPFLSVDISKNFASKHQAFSFDNDLTVEDARYKFVRNEVSLLTKSVHKDNASLYPPEDQEMKNENLDASYVPSSIQDTEWYEKLLIIVTPTYTRPFQAYYLNRLAYILANLPPPLLWVVVEMSSQSPETAQILRETRVMYRHLVCEQNATSVKDRRVHQRNVAIAHIEKHHLDGIVYFADDDRTYSVDVFHQMRKIRRFGTWPVATLIGSRKRVILEGPICNGSQVIGWHTSQRNKLSRRFHVDMSGFAFNSTILWDPKRWHRPTLESIRQRDSVRESLRESTFIEQLVEDESQMEGLPENCSKIMVWHLHLEASELFYPHVWLLQSNLEVVAPLT